MVDDGGGDDPHWIEIRHRRILWLIVTHDDYGRPHWVGGTRKMKSIMVISILQSWILSITNMLPSAESTCKNAKIQVEPKHQQAQVVDARTEIQNCK